jgi:hypothetical protein
MRVICEVPDEDGILFESKSVQGARIQEDDEYQGVRIRLNAHLAGARIPL